MSLRKYRAFSLLEVMVTLVILAILIALSVGALRRYRATVTLRSAAERLVSELQSTTKQLSRTSNAPQLAVYRQDPTLAAPGQLVTARVTRKILGQAAEVVKEWPVGDEAGSSTPITVEAPTNLPKFDYYTDVNVQGIALELGVKQGNTFQELFCVPLEEDGTLWVNPAAPPGPKTGSFVLNNGYSRSIIEISPVGNVKITDNI